MIQTFRYWLKGVRFYIAAGSALITVLIIWWAHASYAGTSLYPTRIEEVYAWLATGLLALALGIGPACKLLKNLPGRSILLDARRLIGVSAAWFASLHVAISYFSLFKGTNPLALPGVYQRSFLVGIAALLILLAMAFTSFDAAFHRMGIWWFRLHRFVYIAAVLTLLHAFMTGVHATQLTVLIILSAVAGMLIATYILIMFRYRKVTVWQLVTTAGVAILLVLVLGYGYMQRSNQARIASSSYGVQK